MHNERKGKKKTKQSMLRDIRYSVILKWSHLKLTTQTLCPSETFGNALGNYDDGYFGFSISVRHTNKRMEDVKEDEK